MNLQPKESIQINIYIEPLLKNARIRTQNGCFIFFSFLSLKDKFPNFISLKDYHCARNRYIKKLNKTAKIKTDKLWYGHILVDKKFKSKILNELDLKYDISP